MKNIKTKNTEEVLNALEEAWTIKGAIAIYPYDAENDLDNIILLTDKDIQDDNLINSLYSNEDIIFINTVRYKDVVKYQDQLRDYFKQLRDDCDKDNMYHDLLISLGGK